MPQKGIKTTLFTRELINSFLLSSTLFATSYKSNFTRNMFAIRTITAIVTAAVLFANAASATNAIPRAAQIATNPSMNNLLHPILPTDIYLSFSCGLRPSQQRRPPRWIKLQVLFRTLRSVCCHIRPYVAPLFVARSSIYPLFLDCQLVNGVLTCVA